MNALVVGSKGKMGEVVIDLLKKDTSFHEVYGMDKQDIYQSFDQVPKVDVIIDFSHPSLLNDLLAYAVKTKTPLVIATTGYSATDLELINQASQEVAIFKSANYSFGVAALSFALKQLSPMLEKDFDIEIIEKHHQHKVDAPSGTSLHLAEVINQSLLERKTVINGHQGKKSTQDLAIHALRGGSIVGEHQVIFAGEDEVIELTHMAQSKKIFAYGAIKAALFIQGKKPGLYNMDDLFKGDVS